MAFREGSSVNSIEVGSASGVELSVIIPVGARHADARDLLTKYKAGLDALACSYQIVFVIDGPRREFTAALQQLMAAGESFNVVGLSRSFGEATAIMAGFSKAKGRLIMTLPAYFQIDAAEIGKLFTALQNNDLVVGRRWPRAGGILERFRRWAFHGLLAWVTRLQFRDLACGARAFKRQVLEEVQLYGDQHRFLAVLADRQGFRVNEVDLRQSPEDRYRGIYGPREYFRSFLDIFTVFFLVRFTKRPLRFFGMMGLTTFGIGSLWTLLLVVQRLFFDQALADRPALLLASLLLVLGLQVFAIGLLGELIIFTHARQLKDYQVSEIFQFPQGATGKAADKSPESARAARL
jgi:glycosyltransferase involved in cell wall biosynthesis